MDDKAQRMSCKIDILKTVDLNFVQLFKGNKFFFGNSFKTNLSKVMDHELNLNSRVETNSLRCSCWNIQ